MSDEEEFITAADPTEADGLFGSDESDDEGRRSRAPSEAEDADRDKNNGDDDESKKDGEKRKIKPKREGPPRRIMLSEDMLCGKNGLLKLQEMFKDFKLQGQGHELHDINAIMYKLEQWVHMLHPKYQFNQTLERIEFLGMKKRAVKTYLKKIRMGMMTATADGDGNEFGADNFPEFNASDHEMDINAENPGRSEGLNLPESNQLFENLAANLGLDPSDAAGDEDDDDDQWLLDALSAAEARNQVTASQDKDKDVSEPVESSTLVSDSEIPNAMVLEKTKPTTSNQLALLSESDEDGVSITRSQKKTLKKRSTGKKALTSDSDGGSGDEQATKSQRQKRFKAAIISSDSDSDMEPLILKRKEINNTNAKITDQEKSNGSVEVQKKGAKKLEIDADASSNHSEASVVVAVDSVEAESRNPENNVNINAMDSDSDMENNENVRTVRKPVSNTMDSDSDDAESNAVQNRKSPQKLNPAGNDIDNSKAMSSDSDSETLESKKKRSTTKFIDSDSDF